MRYNNYLSKREMAAWRHMNGLQALHSFCLFTYLNGIDPL